MSRNWRRRLALGLLVLASVALLGLWAFWPHRLSPNDVSRVRVSMTRAEVIEALGQPPDTEGPESQMFARSAAAPTGAPDRAGPSVWVAVWDCQGGWIVVFFEDNHVASAKVGYRQQESLWDRLGRGMGF